MVGLGVLPLALGSKRWCSTRCWSDSWRLGRASRCSGRRPGGLAVRRAAAASRVQPAGPGRAGARLGLPEAVGAGGRPSYVPLLVWWVVLQPFAWSWRSTRSTSSGPSGACSCSWPRSTAKGVRWRSRIGSTARRWSPGAGAAELLRVQQRTRSGRAGGLQALYLTCAMVLLAGAAIGLVAVVRRRTRREALPSEGRSGIRGGQWFPCGMIAVMAALGFWNALTSEDCCPPWSPTRGWSSWRPGWCRSGSAKTGQAILRRGGLLLLWAVLRYIDLFGASAGCSARCSCSSSAARPSSAWRSTGGIERR